VATAQLTINQTPPPINKATAMLAGLLGTVPRTIPTTVSAKPMNPKANPIFKGVLSRPIFSPASIFLYPVVLITFAVPIWFCALYIFCIDLL
jgi:hypothetical protein